MSAASCVSDRPLKIFISYSRKDTLVVEALRDSLLALRYEVFIDRKNIEKGEEFWARIQQLITDSDIVLFVLSPSSIPARKRDTGCACNFPKLFPNPNSQCGRNRPTLELGKLRLIADLQSRKHKGQRSAIFARRPKDSHWFY